MNIEVSSTGRFGGRFQTIATYVALLTAFTLATLAVVKLGANLEASEGLTMARSALAKPASHAADWPRLLLQIVVIVALSRGLGWALCKLRQPQVVADMLAGIALGPSILGWIAPGLSGLLFAPTSLDLLGALSQVGLTLFMFLVGLELDVAAIRNRSHAVVMTSHASIVLPFFLGCVLSLALYSRLAPPHVPFLHFSLFMGISMSITAFPVLARILAERNMLNTRIGSITIACAAVDDVTAWCLLAAVVALVRAHAVQPLWVTLGGGVAFCAIMLLAVRRTLPALARRFERDGSLGETPVAIVFLMLLASSCVTEYLGIHALFGAFLMGAVMPKEQRLVDELCKRINHVAVVLLLPIFFALTGLRTSIGTLTSASLWLCAAAIVVVAIAGKFGGSLAAARISGSSWREAATLGVLMNTRGLMELVVLNIGYDIGIISRPLFTIMVMMALLTTMMTTPLLALLEPQVRRAGAPSHDATVRYADG